MIGRQPSNDFATTPVDRSGDAVAAALRVRARATGALVMTALGALWAAGGALLQGADAPAWAGIVLVVLAAFALALRRLRQSPPMPDTPPPAMVRDYRRRGRVFLWTSMVEGLSIPIAIKLAIDLGHPQWQLAAVMVVVGLHFVPLAWAFGYRPHFLTGGLLASWALAYPWMLEDGPM